MEDQILVAQRLQRLVKQFFGDKLDSIKIIDNLDDAEEWLFSSPIDLLFLDLELNGHDGFDLLSTATSGSFHTIVVSAHTDQAFRAFDYGVIDFVGKPFDQERVDKALLKLQNNQRVQGTQFLTVRRTGELIKVPLANLCFVKGADNYSELNLNNEKTYLHDKSLEKISKILPERFVRIHKSFLVDLNQVSKISLKTGSYYEVEMFGGKRLPIGRTRYKQVKQQFNDTQS
ncbi:MAG: LytTR family DNA-binding domain-containing protein [Pseudomonadales bacterium]|nr:LytTR family DNA-binding domain-containing protein [Pseudomonadales bacterium]